VQFEKKYKECDIWRRNRLAARILLKARTRPLSERDRRLARTLLTRGVDNYLLDQGISSVIGRRKDRYRRWGLLNDGFTPLRTW
jgi:hypothetical protein